MLCVTRPVPRSVHLSNDPPPTRSSSNPAPSNNIANLDFDEILYRSTSNAIFVSLRRRSMKEELMNSKRMLIAAAGCLGAVALLAQAPTQSPAPGAVPAVPAAPQ